MKILKKIIIGAIIFSGIFSFGAANAGTIEGLNSAGLGNKALSNYKDLENASQDVGFKVINWFRWVFSGILLILIIYAGAQMVMSTGTDDDQLSKAKRTIWYSIIGLIFINFPLEIYRAIKYEGTSGTGNLFIYEELFRKVLTNILRAIQILLAAIAVFVLVYEGIKVITNSKDSEALKQAKDRIVWVIIGLIFIGFIQLWIEFLKGEAGSLGIATNIFSAIAKLALYFAGPIALFFLTLAGYYYIFSNGDQDRMNKGKNIIINTCIGVIILICVYVLLNDISSLTF
ncbi:hypothetical protein BLD25_00675 [Candidatus Gracilibacteria bacterium GN02-872]|nr:hypothetical protein BLD25_00675 [Candidatus Gracilibacteria bacterium GN02-872]RKW21679.1 MAG: hypothetical protein D8B46_07065 [Candidatus Gracilibacteria bacterium]